MTDDLLDFPDDDNTLAMTILDQLTVDDLINYVKLPENPGEEPRCFVTSALKPRQRDFIGKLLEGMSVLAAKMELGVSGLELVLWSAGDLFSACLDVIKEAETIEAEAMTWHNATRNEKAMIERMFAIKSRRPEYKDNAPEKKTGNVNIQVNIGERRFDVSANLADSNDSI